MPVGNLRTAANNDQDDDPRALRPIPIATKDTVSFVEKNQPGQNAEVVRFIFLCFSPTSRFDHHDDDESVLLLRAWSSLLLSEKGIEREREREKWALKRILALRLLSPSLSLRETSQSSQSDLNRLSRCFVLWMHLNERDDYEDEREDKDNTKKIKPREDERVFFL